MALADLLSSLLSPSGSNPLQIGQTAGAIDPGQSTAPGSTGSTPISELLVRPPTHQPSSVTMPNVQSASAPSAQMIQQSDADQQLMSGPTITPPNPGAAQGNNPVPYNYDNSQSVQAVNKANMANQPLPGGPTSQGLYGILPPNLQHGTLRSVLGVLGDAISGGGSTAKYAQMMERQQIGDAMAGTDWNDPASVAAATQRVAATGAPESIQTADQMQKNENDVRLRLAQQDSTNWYRESMANNRTDTRLQSIVPTLGGVLSGVKDSASYDQAYDQIARRIQRIDPNSKPEDLGLPARGTWTPGATSGYGTTGGQQLTANTAANAQKVSMRNTDARDATTLGAAGINAGSRVTAAKINAGSRPSSEADFDRSLVEQYNASVNGGPPMSPGAAAAYNRRFGMPRGVRPLIVPPGGTSSGASNIGSAVGSMFGGNIPTVTPQQAARLPKGTHFRTTDGRILVRQ